MRHRPRARRRRWGLTSTGGGRRGDAQSLKSRAWRRAMRLEPLEPRWVLALEAPPGFLVEHPLDEAGAIETAEEIDTFSLELTGGQTATVLVEPADDLAPVVELRGPEDELVAVTSASAGEPVVLQTIGLGGTGSYHVLVSGGGTLGTYVIQVLLNAAAELEPFTHAANDTLDSAEDLTSSFIDLPAGVARGAVRGTLAGGLRPDAFGYSAVGVPHEFDDISQTGSVLLSDLSTMPARLDSTALGDYSFPFYGRTYSALYVHVHGLITFGLPQDESFNGDLTTAPASPSIAVLWDDLDLGFGEEGGEVLWELRGSGDERRLIIQWNEIQYFPFFSFFGDEDTITFQAVLSTDGTIQFNYLDLTEAEDPFASEGRSATVGIKDGGMQGGRRLLLAHDSAPNEFVDSQQSVLIGTDIGDGLPETSDLYRFSVEAGRAVTLALDATWEGVILELLDAAGTRLAMGTAADNVRSAIADFLVPGVVGQPETFWARISPPLNTARAIDYSLLVLEGGVFDTEPNRSPALAQSGATALGAISSRDRGEVVVLNDFPAIDFAGTDCFCEPPDTHAAVGPGHVVEVVNTAIAIFDKDGSVAMPSRELKDFFDASLVGGELFDFDPVVAYDDLAQRWIVAVLIGATAGAAETDLLYAVSNTSDPTEGFAEQHRIDFGMISPGLFADFPKVGFNADAHVFTVNMFSSDLFGGGFEDVNIVAIDKSTVLDADSRTFSHFISERPGTSFTMAAASMHTAEPGDPMWFVEEAGFSSGNRIRLIRMESVLSGTPLYTDYSVSVSPYQVPPGAVQPGGTFRTNDPRISNADFRDGRLVAAHAVGMAGEATVRWYEFDVSGDAPVRAQEGNIDPGPGVHAYFPSIAINAAGDLGVVYLQSSATEFVSMYVTGQVAGSTPGTMAAGTLIRQGEKTYAGSRGGDYSGIGVDPVSDTFWAANEVILNGAANPLWSTWIAEFTVSDVEDEDWYRVPADAGDELRLETFTPPGALEAGAAPLDPAVALYAPDGRLIATGDNGAPDGRNALVVLAAPESGLYRVQVRGSDATRGNYVLQVSGATAATEPPAVRDTNPDDGVALGLFPTTLQVVFSEAVLSASVEPADLTVGGLPAMAVTQIDGVTFEFRPDPAADAGDGSYEVRIAEGAVVDLQGAASLAYTAAFQLDQMGPRLIETRWNEQPLPADRRLAFGPLLFEAVLDEPLFVLGSARTGLKRPGTDDVFVINQMNGEVIHPRRVSIDVLDRSFLAEFDTLPEGDYRLTLLSGEDAFEDAVGNPLDGEPLGESEDGTPSGDGTPGGDYTVDFRVDVDELVLGDLERVEPEGSLVLSASGAGLLSPSGDEDAVLVELSAGQTFALVVTPENSTATITLQLDGLDPVVAPSAGAAVLLPARRAVQTGPIRVEISSDEPTAFAFQVYVNTIVETADADSTPAQPISLGLSRLEVGGAGQRYAAVGTSLPRTEEMLILSQNFDQGLGGFTIDNGLGEGGGLWRLSAGRRADGDPGHSPPRSIYFGRGETALSGGSYDTGTIAEGAVLSPEIELPEGTQITLSFHHYLETEDFPSFDVAEVAVVTAGGGTVVLSSAEETLPTSTANRWESASADLTRFAGQTVQLRFRFDTVDEAGNEFEGWFIDDVVIVASVVTEPDVDEYLLDLTGEDVRLDVVLTGRERIDFSNATLQIVSADGTQVLASAMADPLTGREANHDLAIRGFMTSQEGRVRIRVESTLSAGYTLLIGRSLLLEGEPNDLDLGVASFRPLNVGTAVLGFAEVNDAPFEFVIQSDAEAFIDISAVGNVFSLSDDGTRPIISHVGNEFFPAGPLLISNNGVVLSGTQGHVPYINEHLPFPGFERALAPFWDDLSDLDGSIYVHRMVVDGVDAFIIQWDNRPHFDSTGTATFQVQILAEGPTPIRYAYRDVDFGRADLDRGASATIGYQRDAATGLEFSFHGASVAPGDVISLRVADPSDNFRLELVAGEVRTLSLQAPTSGLGDRENDLVARLEILDSMGTVVASDRGPVHGRPTVISFLAPSDGTYTVRVVPESGSGEYVLGVSDDPIPGDFNVDGRVDGRDLLNLLLHFGTRSGAKTSDGDADGDGDVDRQDLAVWREHVGLGVTAMAPAAQSAREAAVRRIKAATEPREEVFATSEDWLQTNVLRAADRHEKGDAGPNDGAVRTGR